MKGIYEQMMDGTIEFHSPTYKKSKSVIVYLGIKGYMQFDKAIKNLIKK